MAIENQKVDSVVMYCLYIATVYAVVMYGVMIIINYQYYIITKINHQ